METQKILNSLNDSGNKNSKLATKNWCVIDSESKGNYSKDDPIKFLTRSIESSPCDYSDAYILVTGNTAVVGNDDNAQVVFKNCALFRKCRTEVNKTFIDQAEHINITKPMNNLTEYSDNYSDTSGSLWQFKRDEIIGNINLENNSSSSFKNKSNLIGSTVAEGENRKKEVIKTVVPLKYLSNFWRLIEIALINYKVELSLIWSENVY